MQVNPVKMLFLMTLFGSILISVSSTSWFGAWMGLEINLLSFIPLMSNGTNQRSTEASLKYFLTQTLGSIVLVLGTIYLYYSLKYMNSMFYSSSSLMMINSSLLLKMAAAPFHFWFPMVMEGLTWMNALILMTWQKLGPLMLLFYNLTMSMHLIMLTIILSSLVGGIGGLNQTMLRKIMAFSSINHLSWMMASMMVSEILWLFYFILYITMSSAVVLFFSYNNVFHINQVYSTVNMNSINKLFFSINLLSLGGLPPFTGFLPKWIVIQNLMQSSPLMIFIMIMSTLMTLFYYIRIIFLTLTMSSLTELWYSSDNLTKNWNFKIMIYVSLSSILGLPSFLLVSSAL
uniref:NADH-ubiquinone oxidoreductase chain 2 n=1 Tax=Pedetontinus luanchuanensis TaxID=1527581 RepID=A0A0B4N513_9INSE|nr:NADH dehydrogenase subunit 2 [Pedetontinus luanchuanensis]